MCFQMPSSSSTHRLPAAMSTDNSIQSITSFGDLTPLSSSKEPEGTHTSSLSTTQDSAEAHVTGINVTTIASYNTQRNNNAYFGFIGIIVLIIIVVIIAIWCKYKRQRTIITCCTATPVKRLPIIHNSIYKPRNIKATTEIVEMKELSTDYLEPARNTVYRPTTEPLPNALYNDI